MPLYPPSGGGAAQRDGSLFVVEWDGTSTWLYQGATISARPAGMLSHDRISFIGNPGGTMPAWSATNDIWVQG